MSIQRLFGFLFVVLALVATLGFMGCDGGGDDDDDTTPPPATPTPTPEPPEPVKLAEGTMSIPPAGFTVAASFSVGQSGTLSATITFGGPAVVGASTFRHVASGTLHGAGNGVSPLHSTATVTDALVAGGQNWDLILAHNDAANVNMTYVVTFLPD